MKRMVSVKEQVLLAVTCLLLTGCNPNFTRLPAVAAGQPQVEKRAFERHDPFPDQLAAPDMQVRPRGFIEQRSEPRRAVEERMFQGTARHQGFSPGGADLRGSQYRDAIRF